MEDSDGLATSGVSKGEAIAAICVGAVGLALFTVLLMRGVLDPTHYCILVPVLAIFCLALLGFSRILEVRIAGQRITLTKIMKARDDVIAKRSEVVRIAQALSRLIALRTYFEGRAMGDRSFHIRDAATQKLFDEICDACKLSSEVRAEILKYHRARARKVPWPKILEMMMKDFDIPQEEVPPKEE